MSSSGWFLLSWFLLATPPPAPSSTSATSTPPSPAAPSATTPAMGSAAATSPEAPATVPQATPTAPADPTPPQGTPMPKGLPPVPTRPADPRDRIGAMVEPALWLVGALVLGAIGLGVLKRAQQGRPTKPEDELHAQLAAFRTAHLEGEMTKEEFEKVKAKLAPKIKELESRPPAGQPPTGGKGGSAT